MNKRVVFLHIPKTAGQSIHECLVAAYGQDKVAPVRVQAQMKDYSLKGLMPYTVFSGHMDWMALDFVPGPKTVFTILRDPRERLASFYLYLKAKAEQASDEQLAQPASRGLYLAKNLGIDDYFANMDIKERKFLDDHYDNFYTYYFAGRRYDARLALNQQFGKTPEGRARLLDRALDNASVIDIIGDIADLEGFSSRFEAETGVPVDFAHHRINVNRVAAERPRFEALLDLAPKKKTRDRLESFLELDTRLYARLCPALAGN